MVVLSHILLLSHVIDQLDNWGKVGWSIQVDILKGILVSLNNSIKAINLWVKDVSIEGEAVASLVGLRWYCGSKSIDWELLVRVIVLEDVAN